MYWYTEVEKTHIPLKLYSSNAIPLSTFMGVGVSMCPMLGSPGQGEVGREFLIFFFLFLRLVLDFLVIRAVT